MARRRVSASLLLLPVLLGGCAVSAVFQAPDPRDPALQRLQDHHDEVHQVHHRMAIEAHEAALRLHERAIAPPPLLPVP